MSGVLEGTSGIGVDTRDPARDMGAILDVALSAFVAYWVRDRTVTVAEEAVANAGDVTDSISSAITEVVRELVAVAGL